MRYGECKEDIRESSSNSVSLRRSKVRVLEYSCDALVF